MVKDKIKVGYGFEIKIANKTRKGHVMEKTKDYFVLHDAVTREHIIIRYDSCTADQITEIDAPWLDDKDPRKLPKE